MADHSPVVLVNGQTSADGGDSLSSYQQQGKRVEKPLQQQPRLCGEHDDELRLYCYRCEKLCCEACCESHHIENTGCVVKPAQYVAKKLYRRIRQQAGEHRRALDRYMRRNDIIHQLVAADVTCFENRMNAFLPFLQTSTSLARCSEVGQPNKHDKNAETARSEARQKLANARMTVLRIAELHQETYRERLEHVNHILGSLGDTDGLHPSQSIPDLEALSRETDMLVQTVLPMLSWRGDVEVSEQTLCAVHDGLTDIDISLEIRATPQIGDFDVDHVCQLEGIAVVAHHLLSVQNQQSNIDVFSISTKRHFKRIEVPYCTSPRAICVLPRSQNKINIAVCDRERLHLLTVSKSWDLEEQVTHKLPFKPYSLSLDTASNNLVLTDCENKVLYVYSTAGQQKRVVALSAVDFESPVCSVAVPSGYAVLDCKKNQLAWVDSQGDVLRCYGMKRGDHRLENPIHMVQDRQGNLIVADCGNDRVLMLDAEGRFVQFILEGRPAEQDDYKGLDIDRLADVLCSPFCLYLEHDTEILYIAHFNSSLEKTVIKMLHHMSVPAEYTAMSLQIALF